MIEKRCARAEGKAEELRGGESEEKDGGVGDWYGDSKSGASGIKLMILSDAPFSLTVPSRMSGHVWLMGLEGYFELIN